MGIRDPFSRQMGPIPKRTDSLLVSGRPQQEHSCRVPVTHRGAERIRCCLSQCGNHRIRHPALRSNSDTRPRNSGRPSASRLSRSVTHKTPPSLDGLIVTLPKRSAIRLAPLRLTVWKISIIRAHLLSASAVLSAALISSR